MVDCRVPVSVTNGTFQPAAQYPAQETYQRLIDGQTSTIGTSYTTYGWGVRTGTGSSSPFITLHLDQTYSDVGGGQAPILEAVSKPIAQLQGAILQLWVDGSIA